MLTQLDSNRWQAGLWFAALIVQKSFTSLQSQKGLRLAEEQTQELYPAPVYPWSVRATLRILNRMPHWTISACCEFLAILAFLFARKDIRRIKSNIRYVLGIQERSWASHQFAFQCIRHQIYIFFETFCLCQRSREIQLEGIDELRQIIRQAEDEGRGFVVITGHLGNWEFVGHAAAIASSGPFYALAKPSGSQWVTLLLDAARHFLGIRILWTGSRTILGKMVSVPQSGHGIGFVMDQKPDSRQGHPCLFLGIPATFVGGPALVVSKTQCPVIAIFCVRIARNRYRVVSERLFADGQRPVEQSRLTMAFADRISAAIREHPEQWVWNYRRWRNEDLVVSHEQKRESSH
jgi:lauroyl/myristoyl acyltransferase